MAIKPDYETGTVSITNGDVTLTGVGSLWAIATIQKGDTFKVANLDAIIEEVVSNTEITLKEPWTGGTLAASAYAIRFQPDGSRYAAALIQLQELLDNGNLEAVASLAGEFGKIPIFTGPGAMTLVDMPSSGNLGDVVGPASAVSGGVALMDGTTGKLLEDSGTLTGHFIASDGARIARMADRIFGGRATSFNGEFSGDPFRLSMDPLVHALHSWAFRDADFLYDSSIGSLAIVGHSQASKISSAWPAFPGASPASAGVSGFTINDRADGSGQGWGVYSDAVAMDGAGFTVSLESSIANLGDEVSLNPFNYATSSRGGIGHWIQSGGGLDAVANPDGSMWEGLNCYGDVNHATAGTVYLSSYLVKASSLWVPSHGYVVDDCVEDPVSNVVFMCRVAHTSGATAMAADRAANPTYWKQRPAYRTGIVATAGSVAESSPGSNFFPFMQMTERMQLSWNRKNGSGLVETSSYIIGDTIPDGATAVGLTFQHDTLLLSGGNLIFDKANPIIAARGATANSDLVFSPNGTGKNYSTAMWAGNADGSIGAKVQGRGSGNAISFNWTGTTVAIYVDNTFVGNAF